MAANELGRYETKAAHLPSTIKVGAFAWLSAGTQLATCVPTKAGTLGISIDYATALERDDVTVVRQLLEGIAVGAAKHAAPLMTAPTLLDGGAAADATVGAITLPRGALWRVANGTVERFDQGKYFTVSSMSRPTACAASAAKAQPYLPAGIKAMVETRPWGTTVAKVCVQTTRTIELTLAYDGAIIAADHVLIKALFEAFVPAKKKS
jgi:hypothetical protein